MQFNSSGFINCLLIKIYATTFLHSSAHERHVSAQLLQVGLLCFSHSSAHTLHASIHAFIDCILFAESFSQLSAHCLHITAHSLHKRMQVSISGLPLQSSAHFVHSSAHWRQVSTQSAIISDVSFIF